MSFALSSANVDRNTGPEMTGLVAYVPGDKPPKSKYPPTAWLPSVSAVITSSVDGTVQPTLV